MVVFLLKSSACLAIFLLFYKLLLEKERMHTFKRYYLLVALVTALIIPTITFVEYIEVEPVPVSYEAIQTVPIETIPQETAVPIVFEEPAVFDWALVLWSIYFLGVLFFSLRFLKSLIGIVHSIRNNPKLRVKTLINVLLKEATVPHTFFNYIFLERRKFEANAIPKEVLLHEAAHATQKHSLDILFIELLQIVFWFNPLVYLTKNAMKLNHEFLADQSVLKSGSPTPYYQKILLAFASSANAQDNQSSLANAINYSSIKKRFTVMKTRTSKKAVLFRSLMLLPLLAIMLYSFTETETIYETTLVTGADQNSDEISIEANGSDNFLNISDSAERNVVLAGLILNCETLTPIKNVEIRDSKGNLLSKTDGKGYYKAKFDQLNQEGEILFEYSLYKEGYKLLPQKEHWGDLRGKIESVVYFGLQKKGSKSQEFSETVSRTKNLSYESVIERFPLVKSRFEFRRKIEEAKKDNQLVVFKIDNSYYLVNNSSWIKIGSEDDLISIDDNRIVRASEVNSFIERKEITGMTSLGSNSAKYAIYTIPVDHAVRPLRDQSQSQPEQIIIKINRKGQLLLKEQLLNTGNLKKVLQEINKELTFEERKVSVRAILITDPDAPKKKLAEIEQILESYGVAQIDIRSSENMPPPTQSGVTRKQLSKYNTLAKKYNAQPKAKRVIPSEDLKSLEFIYRKMSENQKADAQPFPECPDPKSNRQEGATKKQMGEYNALAKKYNTMLADSKSIRIKKSDVDRLVHLHGLMTHQQRENAEPFPDFPDPPEPPLPPSEPNLSEKEMADEVIDYIIANQDPHDRPGGIPSKMLVGGKPQEFFEIYPNVYSYFDTEDEDATIYHNGKKISHLEMMQMQKNGEIKRMNVFKNAVGQEVISVISLNDSTNEASMKHPQNNTSVFNYTYKPKDENDKSVPPPPPAPPKPKSPLDYIIEMAKKDARFYYEGKEISSDKAIELMKKNKHLNIDSRKEKGKRPVVKLSKEGVKVGDASSGQHNSNNLMAVGSSQKVELVSMRSNIGKQHYKTGKRILEFKEKIKNCFSTKFYFNGNFVSTDKALRIFIENRNMEIATGNSENTGLRLDCKDLINKS